MGAPRPRRWRARLLGATVAALIVTSALPAFGVAAEVRELGPTSHSPAPHPPRLHGSTPVPGIPSKIPVRPLSGAPELPPTHPPWVRSLGSVINPKAFYSAEPAPMGIADFGVSGSGSGATAYEYTTSSFVGAAQINSMSMSVSGSSSPTVAFELNAMVVLNWHGANYTYWVQNGLHVATATRYFTIGGAYVWNFSSPSASFTAGEVKGNKSSMLSNNLYVFLPGCGGFAGQCSTLSWPRTILGRIAVTSVAGTPELLYQYDLGSGWVTYDNVSFLHLTGAQVDGFVVNGHAATPVNSRVYYDAEWVWVAAGGGSSGRDQGSDLQLSLSFWNGQNYQKVPAAWNFGGDTGESSFNVSATQGAPGPGGELSAQISSGAGTLGPLYNLSGVGFLDLSAPVPNGTVTVGGVSAPFVGGSANLTLVPGQYAVSLANFSNATQLVSLAGGQTSSVNFSGAGRTIFEETGLPPGTVWGVDVGGMARTANTSAIDFFLANGTYSVSYDPVPGYYWNPGSVPATITVPLADSVVIRFSPYTYVVPVTESGLPTGTVWWVSVVGSPPVQSTSTTLTVDAPNGSTAYSAGAPYEFVATPTNGSLVVTAGHATPVRVDFGYRPTFIVGTVTPANATVTVDGIGVAVVGGAFNDSVIPGNHTLVANASGFLGATIPVVATPGNSTVEHIALQAEPTNSHNGNTAQGGSTANWVPWIVVGAAAAVLAVVAALVLARRRGRET